MAKNVEQVEAKSVDQAVYEKLKVPMQRLLNEFPGKVNTCLEHLCAETDLLHLSTQRRMHHKQMWFQGCQKTYRLLKKMLNYDFPAKIRKLSTTISFLAVRRTIVSRTIFDDMDQLVLELAAVAHVTHRACCNLISVASYTYSSIFPRSSGPMYMFLCVLVGILSRIYVLLKDYMLFLDDMYACAYDARLELLNLFSKYEMLTIGRVTPIRRLSSLIDMELMKQGVHPLIANLQNTIQEEHLLFKCEKQDQQQSVVIQKQQQQHSAVIQKQQQQSVVIQQYDKQHSVVIQEQDKQIRSVLFQKEQQQKPVGKGFQDKITKQVAKKRNTAELKKQVQRRAPNASITFI